MDFGAADSFTLTTRWTGPCRAGCWRSAGSSRSWCCSTSHIPLSRSSSFPAGGYRAAQEVLRRGPDPRHPRGCCCDERGPGGSAGLVSVSTAKRRSASSTRSRAGRFLFGGRGGLGTRGADDCNAVQAPRFEADARRPCADLDQSPARVGGQFVKVPADGAWPKTGGETRTRRRRWAAHLWGARGALPTVTVGCRTRGARTTTRRSRAPPGGAAIRPTCRGGRGWRPRQALLSTAGRGPPAVQPSPAAKADGGIPCSIRCAALMGRRVPAGPAFKHVASGSHGRWPYGSVVLVEIERCMLSRVMPREELHVVANRRRLRNGAVMGPACDLRHQNTRRALMAAAGSFWWPRPTTTPPAPSRSSIPAASSTPSTARASAAPGRAPTGRWLPGH